MSCTALATKDVKKHRNEWDCKDFGHLLSTHSFLESVCVFGVVQSVGKKHVYLPRKTDPVVQGTYTTAAAEPKHMNHMPS